LHWHQLRPSHHPHRYPHRHQHSHRHQQLHPPHPPPHLPTPRHWCCCCRCRVGNTRLLQARTRTLSLG
jgi:hypothetical protein